MPQISEDQHRRIHELAAEGYKTSDIALLLELGETAVLKYRKLPCDGSELDPIQEHRLHIENRQLKRQFKELLERKALNARYEDFVITCQERSRLLKVPTWASVRRSGVKHQGIPSLIFSDAHLDEKVKPRQVGGKNGYDRPTALIRVRNMFENTIKVCRDYWKGVSYPGICLAHGGDTFSGFIHAELAQSNAATMMESILYWMDPIEAGIKLLADEFGSVIIPSTVGNHPRNSFKPVHKNRVVDNFDWLFIQLLRSRFERDAKYGPKISWIVPESADTHYQLFDTRYCLTHGDQARGGSGIAGALSPLMIMYARKIKRAQALGKPFDYLVMGHWHQYMMFKSIIVNGALKGYDEYAYNNNFDFEPPRQALWLTDAKYGVTFSCPVHVLGDNEPWMQEQAA